MPSGRLYSLPNIYSQPILRVFWATMLFLAVITTFGNCSACAGCGSYTTLFGRPAGLDLRPASIAPSTFANGIGGNVSVQGSESPVPCQGPMCKQRSKNLPFPPLDSNAPSSDKLTPVRDCRIPIEPSSYPFHGDDRLHLADGFPFRIEHPPRRHSA